MGYPVLPFKEAGESIFPDCVKSVNINNGLTSETQSVTGTTLTC